MDGEYTDSKLREINIHALLIWLYVNFDTHKFWLRQVFFKWTIDNRNSL